MTTRQITLDIPEKALLAEKTDEASFAQEIRRLAAIKLYELGRLSSGGVGGNAAHRVFIDVRSLQGVSASGRTE